MISDGIRNMVIVFKSVVIIKETIKTNPPKQVQGHRPQIIYKIMSTEYNYEASYASL